MARIFIDIMIVIGIMILANIVFNNFEKHLPLSRRLLKSVIIILIISLIRVYGGSKLFLCFLIVLSIGQFILHFWWFPKNGINGLTAEPYDKYLELIKKIKH